MHNLYFPMVLFLFGLAGAAVYLIYRIVVAKQYCSTNTPPPSPQYTFYPPAASPYSTQPVSPYTSLPYSGPPNVAPPPDKGRRISELAKQSPDEHMNIAAIFIILLCIFFVDSGFRTLGGFGSTLLFVASQCLLLYLFIQKKKNMGKFLLLSVPIILISVPFSLFCDSKGYFIPYVTLIILVCLQVVLLSGQEIKGIFSPEATVLLLKQIVAIPLANLTFFFGALRGSRSKKTGKIRNLLLAVSGLVLAIPFLFLLIKLLTDADPLFKVMYDSFIDNLHLNLSFGRFISDFFFGFIIAVFFGAALIYNYAEKEAELPSVKQPSLSPVLGFSFTLIINILLALFSYVQIKYLFLGSDYSRFIAETGYAEYAREGFFQLCYAAAIVFLLAMTVLALCRKEGKSPLYIRLSVLLMSLFSGVLAVSSAKRMLLYIEEYGLSVKRVSTLFGILVILTALFWLIVKCIFIKLRAVEAIGISMVILVMLFSYVNIDRVVSSYNTVRYIEAKLNPDINYLFELSYSAIPDVVKLYEYYATETGSDQFPEITIEQMKHLLHFRREQFSQRDLFTYTFYDGQVAEAFSRLPENILP